MAVLLHLAHRQGVVASREELLAAVWPGLVVGDNALTQVVIKLRKALGDTAREPAYVEAIAKKGYRLIAEVRRSAVQPPARPAPHVDMPSARPGRTRHRLFIATAATLLVLVAAAWVATSTGRRTPRQAADAASADREASRPSALPTVRVLPFASLDPQARDAPIAQALTADLVTDLSKLAGLRVQSGGSVQAATASDPSATSTYVLSGMVQREGRQLRLNVQLAEAASGHLLWSERFERSGDDLFSVQDDVVRRILAVLPVKVSEAESLRLAQRHTRNLQAYEQFIQAQAALLVRRPGQNERARALYWEAIGLDPAFARAYAGVAMTHALEYQQGWAKDRDGALARALELAQASLKMRPDMPEAHWVLGFVRAQRREHAQALVDLDHALRLSPSFADAYALKAGIRAYLGRPAESVPLLRTALRLNPDAGSLYFLLLGRAYCLLGDSEQARVNLNHTLERNAESLEARVYLAVTHWRAGDRDAALWQVAEIHQLDPAFSAAGWLATYPMTEPVQTSRLLATLTEMRL